MPIVTLSFGDGINAHGERWDPLVNLGRGLHLAARHGALLPAPLFVVEIETLTPQEERQFEELQQRRSTDR